MGALSSPTLKLNGPTHNLHVAIETSEITGSIEGYDLS